MPHDGMTFSVGVSMLKEIGASGQFSLGKKYAGRLFEMVTHPDGRIELLPMKAVPDTTAPPLPAAADDAKPPRQP